VPLIAAVALALLAGIALIALMLPVSLVLRYRAGTARRQARGWVAAINVTAVGVSAALLVMGAAIANAWVPRALTYTLAGLAVGSLLGVLGLWWSRWEVTPRSLHYTPNRWLVLAIMLVVTSRLVYGFWRAWHTWRAAPDDTSWLASAGVAGSLAAGAVVLGYYLAYWTGVRRRVSRHTRTWEVVPPWRSPRS
jgi:hypothetical protein